MQKRREKEQAKMKEDIIKVTKQRIVVSSMSLLNEASLKKRKESAEDSG